MSLVEALERADARRFIENYKWMVKEAERLRVNFKKYNVGVIPEPFLVSRYGLEAAMPKGSGKKIETLKMDRREKRDYDRIVRYEEKIALIDRALDAVVDDKTSAVFEHWLDGESNSEMAEYFRISKAEIGRIKSEIVDLVISVYR